jgi:transmembrane 9 superfamily protein 2/4
MALLRSALVGTALLSLLSCSKAFYLPGAAPNDYKRGQAVNLFVNSLTPMLAGNDDAKLVRQISC